jgi:hypothetical protein
MHKPSSSRNRLTCLQEGLACMECGEDNILDWGTSLVGTHKQCSRLSPHISFILKDSQISALQLKDWFKCKTSIQEYTTTLKTHIKLVHDLYGTCF